MFIKSLFAAIIRVVNNTTRIAFFSFTTVIRKMSLTYK